MRLRLIVLTAILAATGVGLHGASAARRTPLRQPLASIPMRVEDWRGREAADLDPETLAVLAADDYVSRVYVNRSGRAAQVFVAYYDSQRQGGAMHSPMNCLPGTGWQLVTTGRVRLDRIGATPAEVNRDIAQKGRDRLLVLYWFQSHGRIVASEYWSKAYLVLDGLRLHRTDAALIRIVAPVNGAADRSAEVLATGFARAMMRVLGGFLPD